MKFNTDTLRAYLSRAPLPLALERALECEIHQRHEFTRPVLDLGCGDGMFAQILFAEKVDTGIDPDDRELREARATGAYDEIIRCYGDSIPKPGGSYNTVFSNSVLEHIPNVTPVFREVHRLLAPKGRFYITVPSDKFDRYSMVNALLSGLGLQSLAGRYRKFFNSFWRHYHYYDIAGWESLARQTGFEVEESFTYDPKSLCLLNDGLAPFSILSFISKKLTNRWVWLPSVRGALLAPFAGSIRKIIDSGKRADDGGLVYLSLRKAADR